MITQFGAQIVFTGSLDDRAAVDGIIFEMKERAVNFAGKTTLKMLAALYAQADMVVSTDTGPMHLAAATGTPVVALFGPTAPWRTGPYGTGHQIVRVELECAHCFKRQCETTDCMQKISVAQVLEAASKVIGV